MGWKQTRASIKYWFSQKKSEYEMFGYKWVIRSIWKDITYPFKKFYRFVVKICKYSKLLWSDFEFDYIYLLKVLQLKFTLMADFFETKGMTVVSPRKAKELRMCANLIQRIIDDRYDDIPLKNLEEKYGEMKWDFTPVEDEDGARKGYSTLHLYRTGALEGTPEYEAERKESRRIHDAAAAQKQRDIDYLCDTMKKRMQGWWD